MALRQRLNSRIFSISRSDRSLELIEKGHRGRPEPLDENSDPQDSARPSLLSLAMRYSGLSCGKRKYKRDEYTDAGDAAVLCGEGAYPDA